MIYLNNNQWLKHLELSRIERYSTRKTRKEYKENVKLVTLCNQVIFRTKMIAKKQNNVETGLAATS